MDLRTLKHAAVGDQVQHRLDGLWGTITDLNAGPGAYVTIDWEDARLGERTAAMTDIAPELHATIRKAS